MPTKNKKRKGLTLLETVVLLGVLAIAAGLLVPVVKRRRENESLHTCQANMKYLALATLMYEQDNADYLPPAGESFPKSNGSTKFNLVTLLLPYLKGDGIFQCPSEPNAARGKTDYAINVAVAGYDASKLNYPSYTILFCESPESNGTAATASAPIFTTRHLGGSDYTFVDGHSYMLFPQRAPSPSNVKANGSSFTFGR